MSDWNLRETFPSESGVVRWDRFGQGDPVVLLHGTPFSSVVWRDVARGLAADHEVFVWDMPGYGTSEKRPDQDISLAAQGRVFADLLRHWELDAPAVIAHDFGGAVALRAHLLHGAAYRRLALVDVVALSPWGSPFFRLVAANANADVFAALPPHLHEALVTAYIASAAHTELAPAALAELRAPWLGPEGQPAFYRQIAQADQRYTDEVEPRYGDIDIPVLVCWGTDDTWVPPEKGRDLAARIPGARLRPLAGAGHLVQFDAPAQLTAALTGFLAESD
ncbi:alpha/beta fold hydrolase [Marinitenerispora sediminis]|uniref:Alpha/beta hydrolase n=1 Tax=Marinitenerispora sediminis TaxID=1931232 RepID=A0A368T5R1_9ACTN|nr:alpha/beta hydrolase [Marinitenerispora sediminis]RCV55012.1 alpha/beta hydrolase [Marinitenerispora sediminis]RCV56285.1 alpha/beta hydrolase [Marinitenerispora sediminis]RCV61217.1 alpha/beta hydrolase [Marinitenerispora sediminis]